MSPLFWILGAIGVGILLEVGHLDRASKRGYKCGYEKGFAEGFAEGKSSETRWWIDLEYQAECMRERIRIEEGKD